MARRLQSRRDRQDGGTTGTPGKRLRSRPSSSTAAAIGGEAATTQDGPSVKERKAYAEEPLPASGNESESTPYDGTLGPRAQDIKSATLTQMQSSESTGVADKADGPSKDKTGPEPKLTPLQSDKPRSLSFAEAKPKEESPRTKAASLVDRVREALLQPEAKKSPQTTGPRATNKALPNSQQTQASYYMKMQDLATSHQREPHDSQWRSRRELPFKPPRFHWTWAVLVALVLAVAALFFLSPLWGRHGSVRRRVGTCVTDECYRVAQFLGKTLNFSVDPCLDFNTFVCSMWKPQSEFISSFEVEMSRGTMRAMANLLLNGKPHFSESAMSTRFMRKCTDQIENPEYLKQLTAFARHVGIPWPYRGNTAHTARTRHPLRIVFDLSIIWGIHTWFDVVLRAFESEARSERAFHIQTDDNPTGSLNFVRTLKINNARQRYYEDFCRLYKVQCQSGAELERLFEIEESVLSILDDAVDRGRNNIARVRAQKLGALTRNVTVAEWTHLVTIHAPEYKNPLCIPSLAPQAATSSMGGNLENAVKLMAVDCYDMASEKLGLLLAAESAVSLFTAAERHHVKSLLRHLNELVIDMVSLLPWSEKGRRYVASKIAGLHVVTFPENLEKLDAYLSNKYSGFQDTNGSLLNYWFRASEILYGLNDSDYEFMQYRWRTYHLELVDYDYWTNQASN
ncbi:hypothetical protein MTO96_007338 [Rhipicephalus appendiculatus]